MSYDLHVYGGEIDLVRLREAVETADLVIEDAASDFLTVVRGKRRNYSFTVERPVVVEPEDVPEEVTAVALAATHLVEVLVKGSQESEIQHAIRAARRIAVSMGGAVLDAQTEEVFHRGRSRAVQRVERGLVSVLEVTWYLRSRDADPAREARAFLAAAKRHLPEALPRRYGSFEPLQKRWDDGGEDAFIAFIEKVDDTVYAKASSPVESASIGRPWRHDSLVHSLHLSILAATLEDERWQLSLQRMFVDFATEVDAVFGSAEVVGGVQWSGRALWYGAEAERATYLAGRGGWMGLTPYPVWLAWFGREYTPIVREYLAAESLTDIGDCVLLRQPGAPADRTELIARLTKHASGATMRPRRWFKRRRIHPVDTPPTWLPVQYLAIPKDDVPGEYRAPDPAPTIPASLTI